MASPHHRGPHLALNPVAFTAPDPSWSPMARYSWRPWQRRGAVEGQSILISLCLSMKANEYPISSIVMMMMMMMMTTVMEFKHVQNRLRIVLKQLSHSVPNIFQSQVSSLETKKLCLLNLVQARRIICATG